MSLQNELGLRKPLVNRSHETLLNIVTTGTMLVKEAQRILKPFGITEAQFNILLLLRYQSDDGRMIQTQLGDMLLVNRSNITGLVDRMEKAGLVRRIADADDRRVNIVAMTERGADILQRAQVVYYQRIDEIMADLPGDRRDTLCGMLEELRRKIREG